MMALEKKPATVFRHHRSRRWFMTAWGAYYDLAKRLLVEKYPPHVVKHEGDFDPGDGWDWPPALCELRRAKARALFWNDDEYPSGPDAGTYFDPKKWGRVARRLAWRLRRTIEGAES